MTNKQAEIALAKKIESSSFETLLAILDKCISSEKTMKGDDLVANLALQKKIKAKLVVFIHKIFRIGISESVNTLFYITNHKAIITFMG